MQEYLFSYFIYKKDYNTSMWPRVLILVLAVAIGIQNTCPHGWAAKTAFLSCHKSHCPMKEHRPPKTENQTDAKKAISNVKQTFVLNIVRPDNSVQILAQTTQAIPTDSPDLKEIFSDPLFRPPISSCLIS
jgi:hypothetical protein